MSRPQLGIDDPVAAAYIAWCEHERIPANTIRRRRAVLRSVGNPSTATREEIETWWATRTTKADGEPRADSSRANELAVLRSFYRWCQIWEHRTDDPTVRLSPPKFANSMPRPASREQLRRILDTATRLDRPDLRRAVCLGAYAGLRISEAAALQWRDVDLELRRLTVVGKGRKRRIVTIGQVLVDELLPATDGNVVTGTEKVHTADTLRHQLARIIKHAHVEVTFHQLRHRYGTIAYQSTRDLVAVRDAMGHASMSTTAGYAAANSEIADAIAAAVTE